jgi:fructose-bisphosphate aldolase class II
MSEICVDRYEAFGTAGQAAKIKPISLDDMHLKYLAGELNQQVR